MNMPCKSITSWWLTGLVNHLWKPCFVHRMSPICVCVGQTHRIAIETKKEMSKIISKILNQSIYTRAQAISQETKLCNNSDQHQSIWSEMRCFIICAKEDVEKGENMKGTWKHSVSYSLCANVHTWFFVSFLFFDFFLRRTSPPPPPVSSCWSFFVYLSFA